MWNFFTDLIQKCRSVAYTGAATYEKVILFSWKWLTLTNTLTNKFFSLWSHFKCIYVATSLIQARAEMFEKNFVASTALAGPQRCVSRQSYFHDCFRASVWMNRLRSRTEFHFLGIVSRYQFQLGPIRRSIRVSTDSSSVSGASRRSALSRFIQSNTALNIRQITSFGSYESQNRAGRDKKKKMTQDERPF